MSRVSKISTVSKCARYCCCCCCCLLLLLLLLLSFYVFFILLVLLWFLLLFLILLLLVLLINTLHYRSYILVSTGCCYRILQVPLSFHILTNGLGSFRLFGYRVHVEIWAFGIRDSEFQPLRLKCFVALSTRKPGNSPKSGVSKGNV